MSPDRTPPPRPDGLADGLDALADALDELALAYVQDPAAVGRLLTAHAARVAALDLASTRGDTPEPDRAMRAAEADGTREALLALLDDDQLADVIPLNAARTAPNGSPA